MSNSPSVGDRPANTPLSRSRKWLFGAGDLTTSAPLAIMAFFQLFFLTDVARLTPALAALPILIGKIWDGVNDPIVGFLADRLKSRFGRRRILLATWAGPVGLTFVLMWLVPPLGTAHLVIYYTLVYIIFDTGYTVVHVAYNSLTPELSNDYDEQSSLHGIRMVYSISGSLLAIIIGTVLQWVLDGPRQVFLVLGIIIGLVIIVPPLIVVRVTREHDRESGGEQPRIREGLRQVFRNRPFWLVMGIPAQANYFVLIAQGVALAFIPLTVAVARKREKRAAVIIGLGSMIPVLLAIGVVPAAGYRVVYVLAAFLGLGIATAYVTPWSMIPDVIQWDARASGARREGSYYAIVSFFQKIGTGGALWMMAQAMEASGYVTPASETDIPVQPAAALLSIRLFITVVPSVLLAAAMAFALFYPISREVQIGIRAELEHQT